MTDRGLGPGLLTAESRYSPGLLFVVSIWEIGVRENDDGVTWTVREMRAGAIN